MLRQGFEEKFSAFADGGELGYEIQLCVTRWSSDQSQQTLPTLSTVELPLEYGFRYYRSNISLQTHCC